MAFGNGGGHLVELIEVGDVALPAGPSEPLPHLGGELSTPAQVRDRGALIGEALGGREPEPGCSPDDHRDPVLQTSHGP